MDILCPGQEQSLNGSIPFTVALKCTGSKPVGRDPCESRMTFSLGSPKTTGKCDIYFIVHNRSKMTGYEATTKQFHGLEVTTTWRTFPRCRSFRKAEDHRLGGMWGWRQVPFLGDAVSAGWAACQAESSSALVRSWHTPWLGERKGGTCKRVLWVAKITSSQKCGEKEVLGWW